MATKIEAPIAERSLSVIGEPGRVLTVAIGRPRPDPQGDWICPIHVHGLGDAPQPDGRGIDAIQALVDAFEAIRHVLTSSGLEVTWEGGELGDPGIPRMVPIYFGRAFARTIEEHIDREVAKVAQGPLPGGTTP